MEALDKPSESERSDLEEALEKTRAFQLATAEDVAFAEECRADAKAQWKAYEDRRTAATKPLNEALREVNSWFKPIQNCLKDIETEWSKKIVARRLEKEAEQRRLLEVAKASEAPAVIREALIQASETVVETTKVSFRDHWVYEIVNEALIPRDYLCPDEKKIGASVAVLKDKTTIPGVRVYNSPIVASRR